MKSIPRIAHARGEIVVPASKSYTVRALLLGATAEGETTIANPLDSDDTRLMLEALRKIGFDISGSFANEIVIGERKSISANDVELFVGNAGTAMRFLTAFLSFTPGRVLLTGEQRMLERPIGDLVDTLLSIGAEIEYAGLEGYPPLRIRGKRMRGGFEIAINAAVSSQFASAIMMAATTLPGGVTLEMQSLASRPYIDITKDIIREFGGKVDDAGADRMHIGFGALHCDRYEVEGDYSSASYWLAAAAVTNGEVLLRGLKRQSAQGDARFVALLESIGCEAAWEGDALRFRGAASLRGGTFDCNQMPDIVPTLAAIAPAASEPIEIVNVANLRVKESDRIAVLARELRKLGTTVEERDDALRVEPGWSSEPVTIEPQNDHRMAMSFAIAGLRRGDVTISNESVVSKSYPRFWRTLDEVVGTSEK